MAEGTYPYDLSDGESTKRKQTAERVRRLRERRKNKEMRLTAEVEAGARMVLRVLAKNLKVSVSEVVERLIAESTVEGVFEPPEGETLPLMETTQAPVELRLSPKDRDALKDAAKASKPPRQIGDLIEDMLTTRMSVSPDLSVPTTKRRFYFRGLGVDGEFEDRDRVLLLERDRAWDVGVPLRDKRLERRKRSIEFLAKGHFRKAVTP